WKLLGAGYAFWQPDVTGFSSLVQVALLLIGLFWSTKVARQLITPNNRRAAAPVLVFCLLFTLVMLWLLVG
ncbi:MAG: hypothetical protein JXB15_11195, partial [Anaerolineales bacterium]|nr:hypothetical protein [Anaerolineales bacterium]